MTRTSTAHRALPTASAGQTWATLRTEAGTMPGLTAAALAVAVAASAIGLVAPWVLGEMIDNLLGGTTLRHLFRAVTVVAVAAVLGAALTAWATILVARVSATVLARLRERALDRALHLPVTSLDQVGTGDLLSRVGDDAAVVNSVVSTTGPTLVSTLITVVLTGVGMFAVDWRLGLAGLAAAPVYAWALRWYLPRSGPYYAKERVAAAQRSEAIVGALRGGTTVRAYRLETEHVGQIADRSHTAMGLSVGVFTMFTRFVSRINRAEFVGLSAVLVVGYLLVRADAVTVGATTAAALYFHRLFNPLALLLSEADALQRAGASLARLVGVARLPASAAAGDPAPLTDTSMEIIDVTHWYDDGPPVLLDISLRIPAGRRVALVGASGAGKTTLAAIAGAMIAPATGSVRIGGVDPSTPEGSFVRRHVGIVTQQVHVFSGPLVEDLRLARPEATEEQVTAALDAVGALGWVRALPDGLHTVVGEGAHQLTDAQAQHLALARLVLADPPVAILDEATAEAGSAGARDLDAAATAATAGRTTLIVAHRLTQAATADRIVVLDRGKIVETGSHAELVSADGMYGRLWRSWSGTRAGVRDRPRQAADPSGRPGTGAGFVPGAGPVDPRTGHGLAVPDR
ncbi:ABC transporter ATP-binding protein [Micromonospora echinospora]